MRNEAAIIGQQQRQGGRNHPSQAGRQFFGTHVEFRRDAGKHSREINMRQNQPHYNAGDNACDTSRGGGTTAATGGGVHAAAQEFHLFETPVQGVHKIVARRHFGPVVGKKLFQRIVVHNHFCF